MSPVRMALVLLALSITSTFTYAQIPPIVTQARRHLDKNTDVRRQVGLAEILRAQGMKQDSIEELRKAAKSLPVNDPLAAPLQALICWRMLPVAPADRPDLREHVAKLKSLDPKHPWVPVWEGCLLFDTANRTTFVAPPEQPMSPGDFPAAFAETAHLELLRELGWSRLHAGMEVIASRSHAPLYALRDLDRALTREAGFLHSQGRLADAKYIEAVRHRYRSFYVNAARHLVEKLFALNQLGDAKERDLLLTRARALPYLHDRARLASLLERFDGDQAWTLLIEPMLRSELALIDNPPDVAQLKIRSIAELKIQSRNKTVQGKTTIYEGDVHFRLHGQEVTCEHLTLLHIDEPGAVILTGSDTVRLTGVVNYLGGIRADRFSYHAESGTFTLGGEIRLQTPDKLVKLHTCTVTPQGELRDAKSWLDDFKNAFDMSAKLELLPKIVKTYDESELPDEVRFILALNTLRPHLTWHAPFLPLLPSPHREPILSARQDRNKDEYDSPWTAALGGEPWMHGDVPASAQEAFRQAMAAWYKPYNDDPRYQGIKPPDLQVARTQDYVWRIRDSKHGDIARAKRLLAGIHKEEYGWKARRWLSEIERNNTVLTFDIPGAAALGTKHSILMDARNVEHVSFKLYRVKKPDEVQFALQKIGDDFLYHDHGLDTPARWDRMEQTVRKLIERMHRKSGADGTDGSLPAPVWTKEQLVHQWDARPADLTAISAYELRRRTQRRHWRDWDHDWDETSDARYFDDYCTLHRPRIDKEYRSWADDALSSWQCDRIVEIPGKALSESGAYVLVAESNGQVVHVPILVDPLSLTLRRCRDGVFALVSDADGKQPIEGATVQSRGNRDGEAWSKHAATDKEGVAFVRVFATGDRPILAYHQGRYAIGGFGQLFEGIYDAPHDDGDFVAIERMKGARMDREMRRADSAYLYGDRHVIVAYTDRPTYRPGQDVQFKLIVRQQVPDKTPLPATFRAEDFDRAMTLTLPALDQPIEYAVLDPKGHEIASGTLRLNDFGTAAGKFALNEETGLGAYTFRVRIAGEPRLVPEVFAVKHYRRPTFDIDISGVPDKPVKPGTLKLKIASQYYFGPPVVGARAEVRVLRAGSGKPAAHANVALGEKGRSDVELRLPAELAGGKYLVVCSVTDESGRTVSKSVPLEIEAPSGPQGTTGLAGLPRFVPVGQEMKVATSVKEIRAEHRTIEVHAAASNGIALLHFPEVGWYRLRAGDDETSVFAFGGDRHPLSYERSRHEKDGEAVDAEHARWVNLSDFTWEEEGRPGQWERPTFNLFALFDRQQVNVGDKLRLLVYVPAANRAKLLFTFEGRTVFDYKVIWTALTPNPFPIRGEGSNGAYQMIEVPISPRCFPNFYLQGRILALEGGRTNTRRLFIDAHDGRIGQAKESDDDVGRDPRWCRIDVVDPKRKLDRADLDVRVETDRPHYRPGDEVRANIRVTDRDGKPRSAELSLAAIDDSVFAFGEDGLDALPSFFRMPHEVRRFQPKSWRVSVGGNWDKRARDGKNGNLQRIERMQANMQEMARAMESMSKAAESLHVRPEHYLTAVPLPRLGGEIPIGNVAAARLREHFHETATWVPQVRTDADGSAKVAFTLPDSLTRYRLTAVALTKGAEVGVGRGSLTAGLPLAVQVFLPRFAVEQDRLQAVAVIHNTTSAPRECRIEWHVQGATAELPVALPKDWKLVDEDDRHIGTGSVTVPAQGTTKLALWIRADRMGNAKVQFKAADGKDADAEARTLPIQPLGRAAEFAANHVLELDVRVKPGEDNHQRRIQLPAGFVARELTVNVHASDLAQALDGLEYLVDYPYGCIEQTMSRFMPVVMVKHATQHSPLKLQPEIEARLPDILKAGLLRVYNHQHADGAWGWFEKDERNNAMTIYVLYGLARCQATGTRVDPQVLRRGCAYLRGEMQANRLTPEQAARTWHVLALAGHADRVEFEAFARRALAQPPRLDAFCNLALACREMQLSELGERLWAKVGIWHAHDTESVALKLNTQLAYGAPYLECRSTARTLLAMRHGTRWAHTRDTAPAIEAIANLLAYAPDKVPVRHVQVTLAGKTVLDIREPAELKKLVYRVRLAGHELPADAATELRVYAESDEPVHVSVRAVGVQRQDELKPTGTSIQLQRVFETVDGEALKEPLKVGQVFRVRLQLQLESRAEYLLVEERRPACCEYADDRIAGGSARRAAHHEFRDDRMCLFFSSLGPGTHEIIYYLRAETAGKCTMLPGCAYPMYYDRQRGETGASKISVNAIQ